jgi:hypothetical protein
MPVNHPPALDFVSIDVGRYRLQLEQAAGWLADPDMLCHNCADQAVTGMHRYEIRRRKDSA